MDLTLIPRNNYSFFLSILKNLALIVSEKTATQIFDVNMQNKRNKTTKNKKKNKNKKYG